jgi:hypothetical protein
MSYNILNPITCFKPVFRTLLIHVCSHQLTIFKNIKIIGLYDTIVHKDLFTYLANFEVLVKIVLNLFTYPSDIHHINIIYLINTSY